MLKYFVVGVKHALRGEEESVGAVNFGEHFDIWSEVYLARKSGNCLGQQILANSVMCN